ncbi:bifunctional indole-3-glycerol-phosphate synthase TrpC/phosphoribosylanthranilate isomerase TrpF [Alteromonas sp. ASW11-130]|uniref:bifunctional indole-3-glycerol-phosphate synthase TrpC/phosphoribosylanthranilate isomerase TrpF n=1 Tax=Alteromonas sp. ASW11-130 TaxID=3015775 RepID=UPI0022422CCE|nr:bifunctional indole-3-glycerol-phosphate synthase TrpC/phosphoribosylanthranilate isomerase TrpF [Alteromonas sp. ASW11-130]MCW8091404.1 bifunctional indole-3-glycerol-phosphate synthase TrpC/phosphoribosylanthranilate isomerase TrpF [Alteromonas sp. ASW11-130]
MRNILQEIVQNKRRELEFKKRELNVEHIRSTLLPSNRSLFDALQASPTRFILECKKASPSKGLIREPFDLDEIIDAYLPHADAISVLTDEKYFQGKYDYLSHVTSRVSVPVINKDFFIDEMQIYLARYHSADAILLMLSVLNDDEYLQLAKVADSLNLDVLTEVSNENEMQRAIELKANIIGINNRNLRDLSTDLKTTTRLVPMLKNANHEFVVVSESGIYTHQDVLSLAPFCNGFLVGSSLMAQEDVSLAVRKLVLGTVKICGITCREDAQIAFANGASYVGMIFAKQSPRSISLDEAEHIVTLDAGAYVGVFTDSTASEIADISHRLSLYAVQLHTPTTDEFRKKLRQLLPEQCEIWQALGVKRALPTQFALINHCEYVDKILLDCQIDDSFGGTGKQFDWSLIGDIKDKQKIILAGGISPDNVSKAAATGAGMIDVNSGVENKPGDKCASKIKALFASARDY